MGALRYGTPPQERMPQRLLAMELRYRIDIAMRSEIAVKIGNPAPVSVHIQNVRELVDEHPQGMRSAHVRHNLGPKRLAWLRDRQIVTEELSQREETMSR